VTERGQLHRVPDLTFPFDAIPRRRKYDPSAVVLWLVVLPGFWLAVAAIAWWLFIR
jgi:hypothetical protein